MVPNIATTLKVPFPASRMNRLYCLWRHHSFLIFADEYRVLKRHHPLTY